MTTNQLQAWTSEFGKSYTDRNPQTLRALNGLYRKEFGKSATAIFRDPMSFLALPAASSVVEVGCNVGNKLELFFHLGFRHVTGVEPQWYSLRIGRRNNPSCRFLQGTIFRLPFRASSAELVFTSGVLIHIAPRDLSGAVTEMIRVSRRYVLGFEYYSHRPVRVVYHGRSSLLWKRDFKSMYVKVDPSLRTVYEKRYEHRVRGPHGERLYSELFVLEKTR